MERITIISLQRTTKTSGTIKLRFRLRDGRRADLTHKSSIEASISDMQKFNADGSLKRGVSIFNESLYDDITRTKDAMSEAYKRMKESGVPVSNERFNNEIIKALTPDTITNQKELVGRFKQFMDDQLASGVIGNGILRSYTALYADLQRFVRIKRIKGITAQEIGSKELAMLREFLMDEYKYVEKWPSVYEKMREDKIPKKQRSGNTIANKMRILRAMFNYMVREGEIGQSPFSKLNKDRRRTLMGTQYDAPVALEIQEFNKLLETDVPADLQEVKDCFVLLCTIGARIADFKSLTMENISVTNLGHPYIHYTPAKTARLQKVNKEVISAIVRCALDIVVKYQMNFKCYKNQVQFNEDIRRLLEYIGIDRKCPVKNADGGNDYRPVYELASSKTGRKTHISLMASVSPDKYAAGLHSRGSNAVNRYLHSSIDSKFHLACVAYGQPEFTCDDHYNIVEEPQHDELTDIVAKMTKEQKEKMLKLLLEN